MNMNNINIDEIIYKWFDMKLSTYDKLEIDGSIYLYYDGDEYADIVIEIEDGGMIYKWTLYEEFSQIISLHRDEFEEFMDNRIENAFGLKGLTPLLITPSILNWLKIPK